MQMMEIKLPRKIKSQRNIEIWYDKKRKKKEISYVLH